MTSNTSKPMTEREAGKVALKELLKPISVRLLVGRTLAALGGVLAIAPYIALVKLGAVFYQAYSTGTEVDTERVTTIVNILIGTFGARLACIGIALGVTHFADAKFAALVRERTIARVASAPLGWFTSTNAGKVRKALQDDISMVHALVAHQPVDVTQAMVTPVALAVYAFVIDWRLGLLTIATLPIYGLIMAIMMRGMGDKTVQVDNKLAQVSATMVEFVTGITVVKAFGTVGRAHKRYQDAADEFSAFYLDWTIPLLRSNAFANATVTIPLLLAINLGGGAAMAHAGWVEPADVLTTSLIALMLPYSIEVLGNTAWTYQTAGAAGLDIRANLEEPIVLAPLQRTLVPTGLFLEIPEGYEVQVRPRSGLAAKHGITVINAPGTIDSDYRGEVKVPIVNLSDESFTIAHGERIAQMIFAKYERVTFQQVEELSDTQRGTAGFGSTGK